MLGGDGKAGLEKGWHEALQGPPQAGGALGILPAHVPLRIALLLLPAAGVRHRHSVVG